MTMMVPIMRMSGTEMKGVTVSDGGPDGTYVLRVFENGQGSVSLTREELEYVKQAIEQVLEAKE